jgi:hypothetical protein
MAFPLGYNLSLFFFFSNIGPVFACWGPVIFYTPNRMSQGEEGGAKLFPRFCFVGCLIFEIRIEFLFGS